jgi:serine/threonine-protein kinase
MPAGVNSEVEGVNTPASSTLAAGQLVADTYKIVRRIGVGGMGEIYEATHLRLAGRYAMKVLKSDAAATPEAMARFQREANVTSALRHPNIVNVVDFSTLPGSAPFMVMEFLDGLELAEVMKRTRPMPLPRVVSTVKQIASGLTAAHENGVVHRDLKPQNVFVLQVPGQEQELVKIVDFGISKVKDLAAKITNTSTVLGTVQYMSPEQARGKVGEIDARTDQFALAAIVYEMLTGEEAFVGDSVSSILYQIVHEEPPALVDPKGPIPKLVAAVLRRALAKDKELRFPSVMEFARALEDAAEGRATPGVNDVPPPVTAPARRRGVWIGAALVTLVVGAAGIGVAVKGGDPHPQPGAAHTPETPKGPERVPGVAPSAAASEIPASPPPEPKAVAKPRPAVKVARPSHREEAAVKKPDCDPNYTVDERGDKHFKPECFLNQ